MLEPFMFKPSCLEKAIIFRDFLSNVKRKWLYEKVNLKIYYILILETGK